MQQARQLGLTKNPRILRHTHVAWLLAAGADLPVIARRIGHKNISTTAGSYLHIMPSLEQMMVDVIDRRLRHDGSLAG